MIWQIKKLGDVSSFDKSPNNGESLPYIGMEDIESNTGKFIGSIKPRKVKSVTFKFNKEYLLYGRLRPYLNKVLLPNFDGHCSTEIFPIKTDNALDKKYLFYWITSGEIVEKINDTCTGARMPRANMKEMMNFEIPLPPLPEQNRIVKILDEVFEKTAKAKENAEKNIKNSHELFESYLQSIFANPGDSWEERELGEMIEIRNGKNQQAVLSEKGEYKILGSAGNVMGYATDFICEAGTTIIGRKGNISKPIYIDERFWNVDTAFGFYPKNENDIDKRFVYYLCLGIDFKSMNRGTTIPSLVKSELQTIEIIFPKSISEQKEIVKKLEDLSVETKKLEEIYSKKLADLDELKKSVLKKAFGGEI
ncbi:MAG: restriction endonuclease subunit S [bacterium]